MPLFDEGGNTGASFEPWWGPIARIFDEERRGKPTPQKPEGKERDDKKKKKAAKWF